VNKVLLTGGSPGTPRCERSLRQARRDHRLHCDKTPRVASRHGPPSRAYLPVIVDADSPGDIIREAPRATDLKLARRRPQREPVES